MTARRLSKHDFGQASAAALAAGTTAPIVPARPNAAAPADNASQAAMARLETAVTELKAMTIAPLLRRALTALAGHDAQSAAELAIEALNLDDHSGLAWHVLAIAREKAGDFKSALQAFEAAVALSPDDIEIANDLGRLALRMGKAEMAVKLFTHYHAAKPGDPAAANNLGCALRELNRHQEARSPRMMATDDAGTIELFVTGRLCLFGEHSGEAVLALHRGPSSSALV